MIGIGWVVKELQNGGKVRRAGWNMHLTLVRYWNSDDLVPGERLPFVAMKTVQGEMVPWSCSQSDLLAGDWEPAE